MADIANAETTTSKVDAAAEKAYAEAATKKAEVETVVETAAPAVAKPAAKKPVAKKAPVKKAVAAKATPKKAAPKKVVAKKVAAKKPAAKKAATTKTAKPAIPAKPANPAIQLKDKIMATAKKTDFVKTAKEAAADVQARVKDAYAKTSEFASEATKFSKDNVEALVESGKILVAGVQELGREDVETGKTVFETVTADVKKLAAIKTPTEFMQLQGELARRNFDAAISFGSKRSETLVKLYNDAFAPISSRASVAAEKIRKAA